MLARARRTSARVRGQPTTTGHVWWAGNHGASHRQTGAAGLGERAQSCASGPSSSSSRAVAPPRRVVHRELEQMSGRRSSASTRSGSPSTTSSIWPRGGPGTLAAVDGLAHARVRIGLAAGSSLPSPAAPGRADGARDIVSRGPAVVRPRQSRRSSAAYNVPQQRTRPGFAEGVEIITRLTQTEPFSYEGASSRSRHPRDAQPFQKPHPPLYQVCAARRASRHGARGWPMLNSVLRGKPSKQLATNREAYVTALRQGRPLRSEHRLTAEALGVVAPDLTVAPRTAGAGRVKTPRCGTRSRSAAS